MRVLHLGKFFAPFAGGIENFMRDLLPACRRLGVEQACLVHEAAGGSEDAGDATAGISEFKRVPMLAQWAYAPISPAYRRALPEIIESFRPDLLHLHLPNTSAFWALLDQRARSLPWVVHWHSDVVGPGLDTKLKLLYPLYRPFERGLLRRAAAIIATSPPYLESSKSLARWRDKCRVIPLGLDPARLARAEPSESDWRLPGRLRVLAVGRLTRYKGFDCLIRAAAGLEQIELVIAGEGDQRRRLERVLQRFDAHNVRLIGAVDDGARNRLMAGCDLLCLPSVNRAEAFGLSLVEAMAAGKPQIATRVPGSGMDWVVEEGRTGWMVTPGSADELAAMLRRLSRERLTLRSSGECARERFEQRFAIDAVARQTVELYQSLLGR